MYVAMSVQCLEEQISFLCGNMQKFPKFPYDSGKFMLGCRQFCTILHTVQAVSFKTGDSQLGLCNYVRMYTVKAHFILIFNLADKLGHSINFLLSSVGIKKRSFLSQSLMVTCDHSWSQCSLMGHLRSLMIIHDHSSTLTQSTFTCIHISFSASASHCLCITHVHHAHW